MLVLFKLTPAPLQPPQLLPLRLFNLGIAGLDIRLIISTLPKLN